MNAKQFYQHIVKPALAKVGADSEAACQLVMGTVWQESLRGKYLRQIGGGPGRGFGQMEPATHRDIWVNFLPNRPPLREALRGMLTADEQSLSWDEIADCSLIGSLFYQVAMCRTHYMRVKEPLPAAGDIEAMGIYWKRYYNTVKGAGTPEQFVANFPMEIFQ